MLLMATLQMQLRAWSATKMVLGAAGSNAVSTGLAKPPTALNNVPLPRRSCRLRTTLRGLRTHAGNMPGLVTQPAIVMISPVHVSVGVGAWASEGGARCWCVRAASA
jgi:hypothetical protein